MKSTRLSVPLAFLLRHVDPGVSSPGVAVLGDYGAVAALDAGLLGIALEDARGVGGDRPKLFPIGAGTLSESTTSNAFPKICLLPMKPSISTYIDSVNSNGIHRVLDNTFFSSLLNPHQLEEPVPSIYSFSFL